MVVQFVRNNESKVYVHGTGGKHVHVYMYVRGVATCMWSVLRKYGCRCISAHTYMYIYEDMYHVYSFMEIYNEKVRDLLESRSTGKIVHGLRVREHPKDGPYVESKRGMLNDLAAVQKYCKSNSLNYMYDQSSQNRGRK